MNENTSTPLIATVLLGLVTAGLLIQVSVNQKQTENNLNEVSGRIKELESEVRQLKEKKQVKRPTDIQLINTKKKVKLTQKERECLARNVFFEAGIESHVGKIAVAQATLNRVQHPTRWKSDVCAVVYQKAQFSWTLEKKKRQEKPTGELWTKTLKAVADVENGVRIKGLDAATFYHTDWIRQPKWACDSKKIMKVGQHIFYKDDLKV
jgi:spore germination cell wall hydrolase CwlJ-like protein